MAIELKPDECSTERLALGAKEMREVLAELTRALDQSRDCVYCSVVEARGSTPQKAGAAMLVFPDGSQLGTLGGGCVEAEVKQRALGVLASDGGRPEVLTFCLDDNYGWDDGLICGGRMSILADPLPGSAAGASRRDSVGTYYRLFRDLVDKGNGCTEAVVVAAQSCGLPIGSRYLFDGDGRFTASIVPTARASESTAPAPDTVSRHLPALPQRPRPAVHHGVSYLPILPRITLFLIGGGHVAQAVARLAAEVDFDVWVLDDRERYASRERFPTAGRLLVGDIGTTLKDLGQTEITPSTYCLIVTRGHAHDEEALYHLASTPAGYVGMIGSKRKIKLIYQDLMARGITAEILSRVHAPLGFAIGSQTVPEIAVSIVAELIACRNLGHVPPGHGRRERDGKRE
jgi:xanthine dehydrogenase accessory factor